MRLLKLHSAAHFCKELKIGGGFDFLHPLN